MKRPDWRVESYRGLDVYALISRSGKGYGYEVRVGQEGCDPADAGEVEILSSDGQVFVTSHAAEVAAFGAGYAYVDRVVGPVT